MKIKVFILFVYISTNKMIPVDIDNFIIDSINYRRGKYVIIRGIFKKIPKEVGNCHNLTTINLYNSQIVDISAFANLSSLKVLYLGSNQIVDITPLYKCYSLTYLNLANNQIVDISSLSNLTNLEYLDLINNKIKNKLKSNDKTIICY